MTMRWVAGAAAAILLCGCSSEAPPANQASATPVAPAKPTPSPLREWLVGAWTFDADCKSGFVIRYNADGTLDNAGETGTWELDGDRVVESISQRAVGDDDVPARVDPPEKRGYSVARTDASHGVLSFQQRSVSIRRC